MQFSFNKVIRHRAFIYCPFSKGYLLGLIEDLEVAFDSIGFGIWFLKIRYPSWFCKWLLVESKSLVGVIWMHISTSIMARVGNPWHHKNHLLPNTYLEENSWNYIYCLSSEVKIAFCNKM